MPLIKYTSLTLLLFATTLFFAGCNSAPEKSGQTTTVTNKDSVKSQPATPQIPADNKPDPDITALMARFKANTTFPVIIDSAYCVNMNKGDSLGAKEVKMLTKKWFNDSLVIDAGDVLKDFYKIDSIKAKGAYEKWINGLSDYVQVVNSDAYALQRITLADGKTLLVWGLQYSDGADPLYNIANVYFTIADNNKIGETFLLGSCSNGADPPAFGQTVLAGKLMGDGSFTMEKHQFSYQGDTNIAQVDHALYKYAITNGTISLVSKKNDATMNVKVPANMEE